MRATIGGDCDALSKGFRNVTEDTANNSTAAEGGRRQAVGGRATLFLLSPASFLLKVPGPEIIRGTKAEMIE